MLFLDLFFLRVFFVPTFLTALSIEAIFADAAVATGGKVETEGIVLAWGAQAVVSYNFAVRPPVLGRASALVFIGPVDTHASVLAGVLGTEIDRCIKKKVTDQGFVWSFSQEHYKALE